MTKIEHQPSLFIWITFVIFFVLIDTSTIQYVQPLQLSRSQIFVIFLCQSLLALCQGLLLYQVSHILQLPKEHEIWYAFLLGFIGTWSIKILTSVINPWGIIIAICMWIGIAIGMYRPPSSKIRSGTVLLASFVLAAQISSQRMSSFQTKKTLRDDFRGVLFIVVESMPDINLPEPYIHVQNIRMSTTDDILAKKTLLYGKKPWENIVETQDQTIINAFEKQNLSSICISENKIAYAQCNTVIEGQDLLTGWKYSFYGQFFPIQNVLSEDIFPALLQSKDPLFIYVDTVQLSDHMIQKILPQAIAENYVVSLLSLKNQTFFQEWFVWYPNGITNTKKTTSLFEHHDITPTLLGFLSLPQLQTSTGAILIDAMYGKPARPFVRQIQNLTTNPRMHVWIDNQPLFIDKKTQYHTVEPFLSKDLFEDLQYIVEQTQQTQGEK